MREFRTAVEQTEIKAPDGRNLERVTFACEIKDLDEKGRGVGYLSVYGNEDSYGDVVDEGAFVKTCAERSADNPLPFLWQHYSDEPIGVYTKLDPRDSYGLRTEFRYVLSVQRAREAYDLAQAKACKGQSIGFTTLKDSKDSDGRRHLHELRLWEGSQVTFPANDLATIGGVKSGMREQMILDLLTEIRAAIEHKWDGSASRYTDHEWMAACILDRGEAFDTAKERYGLPIADPGKSYVSPDPGGVSAAASRIDQVSASPEAKHTAYLKLVTAYHTIGHPVPDNVAAGAQGKSFDPQTAELASLLAEVKAALSGAAAPTPEPTAQVTREERAAIADLRRRMETVLSER